MVLSGVSFQGKSATSQVTVQNIITSASLDTGANIIVVSEKVLQVIVTQPSITKIQTHKVTSASGANLGPIGHVG